MNVQDVPTIQFGQQKVRELTLGAENARHGDEAKLREASRDFEAIFIKLMLDSMRKTVNRSGLIDGGFAETIYEDMLYERYAEKIADTARLGIAETLYDQMSAYL